MERVGQPVFLLGDPGGQDPLAIAGSGAATLGKGAPRSPDARPLFGYAAALSPEHLGDPGFASAHGMRYPYVIGAMANGIASEELVEAAAHAGFMGFFGAAGLPLPRVEQAIDRLGRSVGDLPHGFNLIHSPNEPELERGVVDLYIQRRVRVVSASAYLGLTLPLVRYRVHGIYRDGSGTVVAPNRVVGKVSRTEVARRFLSPPPDTMLQQLVEAGDITAEQAELARTIPVAEDITAEADSGGHTDNRPALALLPTLIALRDELQAEHGYARRPRVGAAGGLGTPAAVAAAFSMGAAYVLTGSVNQSCREAGTSELVRRMLCEAEAADVIMAPAADMFEMGVKVQVLKRGTMFAQRGKKLYDLYRAVDSLDDVPAADRKSIERDLLKCSFEQAWQETAAFFRERDPSQIERAERDPKHKMALVFRSYLGRSSDWANRGVPDRRLDYQVWCGPAMGAFNQWVKGTFLETPDNRDAVTVGMNLLVGAAALTRLATLRTQLASSILVGGGGALSLPVGCDVFRPRPLHELSVCLESELHV